MSTRPTRNRACAYKRLNAHAAATLETLTSGASWTEVRLAIARYHDLPQVSQDLAEAWALSPIDYLSGGRPLPTHNQETHS